MRGEERLPQWALSLDEGTIYAYLYRDSLRVSFQKDWYHEVVVFDSETAAAIWAAADTDAWNIVREIVLRTVHEIER